MLFDPTRHEPLRTAPWSEARARASIERIVRDTEATFSAEKFWPMHPKDADLRETKPAYTLYFGACGVIWALRYLQAVGAIDRTRDYAPHLDTVLERNRAWLGSFGKEYASYLMGETSILLLKQWFEPDASTGARLEQLIAGNLNHPARELMWGSPGTLLAALFLHEWTGETRWADLYRATTRKLWSQLLWSDKHQCHYWTQDMYRRTSTYIDGVHGFAGTAPPLIRGRHLMAPGEWDEWLPVIVNTVTRTVTREGSMANWWPSLYAIETRPGPMLMQYCHGAPGFAICLADLPGTELHELLIAGGEATWAAGPLTKGSNLCHGTGGNGYAFLKLYQLTQDEMWLQRARAFAMHGIEQTLADAAQYGHMRYSLWTGDPGFAIYLWDCIRGRGAFPTLDVFFSNVPTESRSH